MKYRVATWCVFILILHSNQASEIQEIESWNVAINDNVYTTDGINGIYTIAQNAGLINEHLFYKYQDSEAKWLALGTYVFTNTFQADDLLSYNNIHLVLEGIDLISTVQLNNAELGQTNNMYVRYIYDVKELLKSGENVLQITIESPLVAANDSTKKYTYPFYPECPSSEYQGDCHANLIRKMPASFSWDWGPSVPSIGIWKPVYLEAFNDASILDLVADVQSLNETHWQLNMDVYFSENQDNHVKGQLDVKLGNLINDIQQLDFGLNENNELVYSKSYEIEKSLTELWWPNGYGNQTTYRLQVAFVGDSGEISAKTITIGFRSVELVQDETMNGLTFYFKINGLPMFMKGSNLIPVDIRPEIGQDPNLVKRILTNAQKAHMNMIRIWGGGVYESDYLYDLADELGIMIWQDFMFACALYPSDEEFLNNVVQEVRHQVKRIYSHPSVALFSGNNENEGLLMDNWYAIGDRTIYKEDYVKLYVDTIKTEFERLTHNRGIFVTSSPSNGKESESEGYLSTQPGNSLYGDVHYYNYEGDPFNPETYPVPRFCSEYGFQSLPSIESWSKDTDDPSDYNIYSQLMNYRQHHPDGLNQMINLITSNLELPAQDNENFNEAFIYYSQILQAYAYKIETERYRIYRSIQLDDGRGLTMGALYWQLNDVWVAPTWASVDYYNTWKMAHYAAVEFFKPTIVTGHLSNGGQRLDVFAITDVEPINNGNVIVDIRRWNSVGVSMQKEQFPISLEAGSSGNVTGISPIGTYLEYAGCNVADCYIKLQLVDESNQIIAENFVLPVKLKEANLPQPVVKITLIESENENVFSITLTTDSIALFVWLDTHGIKGQFSQNGFLLDEESINVKFYSEESISIDDFQNKLTVVHLKDQKYFPENSL